MSVASSAERPRRHSRPVRFLSGAVVALFVALAVQVWAVLPAGADPSLQSTGSSFAGPAIQTWAGAAGIDQGLNINFQTSNSVTGMAFFAESQVDFGASDIPYSTGQSPATPSQPYEYLPDVAGGLAMMYNLTDPNTGLRVTDVNLSAQDIANIFLGKVTTWEQLNVNGDNPELAGITTPIDAIYRSDGAGENYLLSDYLLNEVNSTFVAAQQAFGLSTSGPSSVGNPSATWPTPACENTGGCSSSQLPGYPGWTTGSGLTGASGADATSNDTLATNGAITYVETAYAKEDRLPVVNLLNASGQYVQPTSVNVAIALEKAILHADLTQDLTGVYSNTLSGAYPLSSYSYFITPCQPSQAAVIRPRRLRIGHDRDIELCLQPGYRDGPVHQLHRLRGPEHHARRLLPNPSQPRAGGLLGHRPDPRRRRATRAHRSQLQEPLCGRPDPASRRAGCPRCASAGGRWRQHRSGRRCHRVRCARRDGRRHGRRRCRLPERRQRDHERHNRRQWGDWRRQPSGRGASLQEPQQVEQRTGGRSLYGQRRVEGRLCLRGWTGGPDPA